MSRRRQSVRRLNLESLTDRSLPSASPLIVVLIGDDVGPAAQVQAAAARGVVALTYDSETATLDNLVGQLEAVSQARGGVRIGHLGLVAHGRSGAVAIGDLDTLDAQDVAADSAVWQRLRAILAPTARLDLYACNVAAGSAGKAFVNALAARTGTAVYASDDPVGTGKGADFTWEYNTAVRGRSPLFHPASLKKIAGLVLDDQYENNDTLGTVAVAQEGTAGSPNLGTLTNPKTLTAVMEDEADWFRFRTAGPATAQDIIRLEFGSGVPNNLDLYLYDEGGNQIQTSTDPFGNFDQLELAGLRSGVYYVEVSPRGTGNTSYTLLFDPPAALADDAYERNDNLADVDAQPEGGAQSPNLGLLTAPLTVADLVMDEVDGQDWFKFRIDGPAAADHAITLSFNNADGQLDLYLYNAAGAQIQSSTDPFANFDSLELAGLRSDTYYVQVVPRDGNYGIRKYDLRFAPPPAAPDDRFESNDSREQVDGRAEGPTDSPNLGLVVGSRVLSGLVLDDEARQDWFKFRTSDFSGPTHSVSIAFDNADGQLDLYLYNAAGVQIATSTDPFADFERIDLDGLPGDTYYAQVVSRDFHAGMRTYDLEVKVPGVGLSVEPAGVTEGDAGLVNLVFTVTRAGSGGAATVQFATADGTATGGVGAGFDYEPRSGTLSFGAGESSKTIAVPVRGDLAFEGDETFLLNLFNPTGAQLNTSQAVGTIRDDDAAGVLQFSAPTYNVNESVVTAFVKVTRTGGADGTVTVRYATGDGSAVAPGDYAATTGTLTFNHGELSETIAIPVVNDSDSEPDETVNLVLSDPTGGATLGDQTTAELVILANDRRAGTIQFGAATVVGSEASGKATLTVQRVNGADGTVTVRYATANRTARAGADYTAETGTLTFQDGETSQTLEIEVANDAVFEPAEQFVVILSAPTGGARLGVPRTATVTIDSDDPLVTANALVAGAGNSGLVKVIDGATGAARLTIQAFPVGFKAGVRVATGDVNGDTIPDIIAAPGPNGGSTVKVFDGRTGQKLSGVLGEFPHGLPVAGGIFVAAGDVTGDSQADLIVGAGDGTSLVRVFSGADRALVSEFQAFLGATHGVRVAVGDVAGDGAAELVVGAGPGGNGEVRTFTPLGVPVGAFPAFAGSTAGTAGVSVAVAGDKDGDGKADIVVGTGAGVTAELRVLKGTTGTVLLTKAAFAPSFKGGVWVSAGDVNGDGILELIAAPGAGSAQKVKVFDLGTGLEIKQHAPFGSAFRGGVFAAGVR